MLLLTWQKELSGGTQVLGAWAGVVVRNGFSMCLRYWPTSGFCSGLTHRSLGSPTGLRPLPGRDNIPSEAALG